MPDSGPMTSRIRLQSLAMPALLAGLALAACSNDNPPPGSTGLPASTDYVGIWAADNGVAGPLTITFASAVKAPPAPHGNITASSAAPVGATAVVGLPGTTANLTGSLADNGALSLTGAGLTIAGTLANGVITGTITDGTANGSVTAASNTDGTPARSYCGQFSGTGVNGDEFGTFSLVVSGAELHGVAVGDGSTASDFEGTATPGASGGTFKVNQTIDQGSLIINDGVYNETETHGTYKTTSGGTDISTGNFSGLKGCPAT